MKFQITNLTVHETFFTVHTLRNQFWDSKKPEINLEHKLNTCKKELKVQIKILAQRRKNTQNLSKFL